jgi:predicted RNase H-like HicB family nuclease
MLSFNTDQTRREETLTIVVEEHDGCWAAFVPEVPGNTISAVRDSRKDALLSVLDRLRAFVEAA